MKKAALKFKSMLKRYRMLIKVAVIVIAVCLVIISGFLIAVNDIYRTSNIKREIVENEAIVEQISSELQESMYSINDMSLSIYANQRINSAILSLHEEPDMGIVRQLDLKNQISNSLQTYQDLNEMVVCSQIYLLNRREPITTGELTARHVSEITKEYQNELMDQVFETGGELQVFSLDCKSIIFTRALGDFNTGKRNEDYIYSIVLVLSDSYINKIMDKLYYSNYSHGKMICLLDEAGRVTYSTNRDFVGVSADDFDFEMPGIGSDPTTIQTKETICSIEFDPHIRHYIMVTTELKEIDLYADTFRVSTLTIILALGAVLLIVIFLLTTVIGRPVQDLINSIKRIGIDRESVKLVDIGDGGDIAISFNEAIARVERIIDAQYQNEINQKNAHIAILQLQINPHFIFNTLETISWTIYKEDKEQSIKMITALGKILRYTTYNYSKMVRIIDEINIIEKYLYFEEVRHGSFKAMIDVDPSLEDFKIPCLLLQPIVENSCIHGIRNKENGRISISIRRIGGFAEIVIEDNGKGMPQEQIDALLRANVMREGDDEHIGVINVKERVYSAFGEKASFEMTSVVDEYMRVCMKLPINEVKHD